MIKKQDKQIDQSKWGISRLIVSMKMVWLHKREEIDSPLISRLIVSMKMCDQNISWWKRVYMKAFLVPTSKWRYVNWNKCKVKCAKSKWKWYKEL